MIKRINFWEFEHEFNQCRPDNFTHDGLRILFDYFEEFEDNDGEPVELDVIAICCEWSELTREELIDNYDLSDEFDEFSTDNEIWDYLNDKTMVAGMTETGTIVFMDF
jgi:hypothetical protein